jgi:hypothetical protein
MAHALSAQGDYH